MENENRYQAYLNKFNIELSKHGNSIYGNDVSNLNCVIADFKRSAFLVSQIPYQASSVELLPMLGYKFAMKLFNGKKVMISKYADNLDVMGLGDTVVYTVYSNPKINSGHCLLSDLLEKLNKHL